MKTDITSISAAIDRLTSTLQKTPLDWITTVVVWLSFLVLVWYTVETFRLRMAAQKQNEATAKLLKEAQRQNDTVVMPMLAVYSERSGDRNRDILLFKNVGPGPAFNLSCDPLSCGNGVLTVIFESTVQMPGQSIPLSFQFETLGSATEINLGVSDLYQKMNNGTLPHPLNMVLRCRSISSVDYAFNFRFTLDAGRLKATFEGTTTNSSSLTIST